MHTASTFILGATRLAQTLAFTVVSVTMFLHWDGREGVVPGDRKIWDGSLYEKALSPLKMTASQSTQDSRQQQKPQQE